jgi:competence protein ComEC
MSKRVSGASRTEEVPDAPLDLRLSAAVLGVWAATLWALSSSAVIVMAAAAVALLLATLLLRLGHSQLYAPALVAFAIALALAPLAVRLHLSRDSDLSRLAAERIDVTAQLTITSDPRPLAAKGVAGSPRMVLDGSVTSISIAGRRTAATGTILVLGPLDAWRGLLPGQRVSIDGLLAPPFSDDLLTATLTARTAPDLIGSPPWWQRAAGAVRAGLQRACAGVGGEAGGLLPGVVDGDTSQLDPVLADRFRVAGLTHLIAVSGTNCSILVGTVGLLLRRLRASPRTTVAVSALVLVAFVIVARPSPSVLRAAFMTGVALVSIGTGRPRSGMPMLAGSVLLLLLWQPALAVNVGFVLSVAATASLMVLAPGWATALHRHRVPGFLAEGLAVAAAAHLVSAPIIVGISGQLSLVAVPANLLAEPVVGAATVLGVLAAATAVPLPWLAAWFANLAAWPCRWLVWVANYFGSLPGATVPWPSGMPGGIALAVLSLALVLIARRWSVGVILSTSLAAALLVQIPVRAVVTAWPATGWIMVVCDVGQGDAIALADGPGQAVLIDTGPDPVSIDRCLRQLHITRIPLLVLSHDHLDHVGGLPGVFHDRSVGRVVESPLDEPASGHRLVLDTLAEHNLVPGTLSTGSQLSVGPVQLQVLGPVKIFHGSRSDPNNASIILRAVVAGTSILLPGDAEIEAQDALLDTGADLRSDILKVPHHGSAYSDPAFLAAVHARLGLVSVGRNNDYGLPSPLLIAEMARLGVPTYRTDQVGDIAVIKDSTGRLVPVTHNTRTGNALAPVCATMARCPPPPVRSVR